MSKTEAWYAAESTRLGGDQRYEDELHMQQTDDTGDTMVDEKPIGGYGLER